MSDFKSSETGARLVVPEVESAVELPKVTKPDSMRDLGEVDAQALRDRVLTLPAAVWVKEDARKENRYEVLEEARHIIYRFIRGNRDPRDFYETPGWAVWHPLLMPLMQQASRAYGFLKPEFPKVMLALLPAGATIPLHRDGGGSNPFTHKIHVPLITTEAAIFQVRDECFHLPAGRACEVNNLAPHGAHNNGSEHRIHFIFEVFEAGRS